MKTDRHPDLGHDPAGELLVFVHIPKTAGTTLNAILAHRYRTAAVHEIMMRGMSLIVPGRTLMPRPLVSSSKLRRLRSALAQQPEPQAIHGHFDMSLARLLPASAQYVTLLRDPVERAISHYYHYRNLAGDPVHAMALRSTLAQWVSACGLVEMDNGQTRRLAGEMGLPAGEVSAATLDKAKSNLAGRFAVVGLTERFEESQILLHRALGWPYCRYRRRNVAAGRPRRSEVGRDALAVVEHCNRFDLELYRFAADLFERAIGRIDIGQELALLRAAPEYGATARAEVAHDSLARSEIA